MPFKLRLKKSRQYNVVSKNMFVISVELLDNTIVECTLSSDSTGKDCLSNVCQRLGLHQPEFFGLRFLSKRLRMQWVDLDKPLKKQLDKHANDPSLYLGVMFYISDVQQLQDEMTRYQYFLQLKTDIIEGRLQCNQEQAVQLASYSLQAEFGDHDPERHTVEYLKGFVLLPKDMSSNEIQLEALTESVVYAHRNLQGLSPAHAEVYYIVEVQHLSGYGQENFTAKDDSGNELCLGVSLSGIIIKGISGNLINYYSWTDISNLTFHKRTFGIECEKTSQNVHFQLEDVEVAKYIGKVCIHQHQFHMKNKLQISKIDGRDYLNDNRTQSLPDIHNSVAHQTINNAQNEQSPNPTYSHEHVHPPIENLNIVQNQPETTYDEQQGYHFPATNPHVIPADSVYSLSSLGLSNMGFSQNLQSSSSLNVISNNSSNQHLRALLPSYRPAPDYETALQHKYGSQGGIVGVGIGGSHAYTHQEGLAYSQPEIGQQGQQQHNHPMQMKTYSHYKNFTNLANLESVTPTYGSHYTNGCVIGNGILPHRAADRTTGVMSNLMLPPMHTYSTPELPTQGLLPTDPLLNSEMSILQQFQYKLPPPYPYTQCSSASTPDLASQAMSGNRQSNSSPDLVSRRQLGVNPMMLTAHAEVHIDNERESVMTMNANGEQRTLASELTHVNSLNTVGIATPVANSFINNIDSSAAQDLSAITHNSVQLLHHQYQQPQIIQSDTRSSSDSGASMYFNGAAGNRSRASSTQSAPEVITTGNGARKTGSISSSTSEQLPDRTDSGGTSVYSKHPGADQQSVRHQTYEKRKGASSKNDRSSLGPMMMAAMNGLTLSRPDLILQQNDESRAPRDTRKHLLETRLAEGLVFIEFEQLPKKRANAEYMSALMPENASRNRFKDVLPYEDNRVRLAPTKDNKTGYINASHVSVTIGQQQRFYIAAQGPLAVTVSSFWQMVWEQHVQLIVMLTEIRELGRDKCFPYWPHDDNKLEFGEYHVVRKFINNSTSYVTSSLLLIHLPSKKQRVIWHIQYTDWPDHGCPEDVHGFLRFMEELDTVRRHAADEVPKGRSRNPPVVVHCSAGVGRSGVTILTDLLLYCLDHNENIDVPKMLAHLRHQRMLIVQTVAQYKFIYTVLIQYLNNSRLI